MINEESVESKYEIIKPIGKGKFAIVYRAKRRSDDELVALKKISIDMMDQKSREKTLKEVRLLQGLEPHQNVIRYLDAFIDGNELIIVFEWAAAGDLKRQIRKAQEREMHFDERVVWKYFSQICEAIRHMHSHRVMHRDLKPANIFLTLNGTVKVGDLGLGRELSEHTMEAHSKVGTPLYMSPEVLRGDGYDWKSDIWSLGCLLYELAMLKSPFKSEGLNLYSLFQKISKGDYQPLPEQYSDELKRLAYAMISTEPSQRPDLAATCEVAQTMRIRTQNQPPQNVKMKNPPASKAKKIAAAAVNKKDGGGEEKGAEGKDDNDSKKKNRNDDDNNDDDNNDKNGEEVARSGTPPASNRKQQQQDINTTPPKTNSKLRFAEPNSNSNSDQNHRTPADELSRPVGGSNGSRNGSGGESVKDSRRSQRGSASRSKIYKNKDNNHETNKEAGDYKDMTAKTLFAANDETNPEPRRERRGSSNNDTDATSRTKMGKGSLTDRMETIHSMLTLLQYPERLEASGRPNLLRTHFSLENGGGAGNLNRHSQFVDFLLCCEYLLSEMGHTDLLDVADIRTEAPNAIATQLLRAVNRAGFSDESASRISPMNLTPGFGEGVCEILEWLCPQVLEKRGFRQGEIVRENNEEMVEVEEEKAEGSDDEIEDEVDALDDGDDEGAFNRQAATSVEEHFFGGSQREMVISNLDANEWRMELERVGPRLRVAKNIRGGWGSRLENAENQLALFEKYSSSEASMESLHRQLKEEIDRIERGEGNVKNIRAVKTLVDEYVRDSRMVPELRERHSKLSEALATTADTLANVADDCTEIKNELSNRGESMSDTKQLVNIKKTIKDVGFEIAEMDLRLGVLMHTLWGSLSAHKKGQADGFEASIDDDDDENTDEC